MGPAFEGRLLEIAREYRSWSKVNRDPKWSPTMCRIAVRVPQSTWVSASADEATHGRKLYDLFVRDPEAYTEIGGTNESALVIQERRVARLEPVAESPVGQAVVKESWHPVEVPESEVGTMFSRAPKTLQAGGNIGEAAPVPYAEGLGNNSWEQGPTNTYYSKGEKNGLFIMYKLDPSTPGTDHGWVYGTVSADGARVLGAGTIASCMECHTNAPRDRLFGMVRGR